VRGRGGCWREAAADLSRVAELRPDDYGFWNNLDDHYLVFLAAALVQGGDLEAYGRLRGQIRQRFGGTASGELATLMAWACLLVPSSEPQEMVTINQLVDLVSEIAGKRIGKRHIRGPLGVRGRNSDNRLIKEKLNWEPNRPLRVGLEPTYRWIETQVMRNAA